MPPKSAGVQDSIHRWASLLQDNFLAFIDIKAAYLHLPICAGHQHFLSFEVGVMHYRFVMLPLGLAFIPWFLPKCWLQSLGLLRQWWNSINVCVNYLIL